MDTVPSQQVDRDRLRLMMAAERERASREYAAFRRPRKGVFFAAVGVIFLVMVVIGFLTPAPPTGSSSTVAGLPADSAQVAVSLASSVDSAAARTGLSPAAWMAQGGVAQMASVFVAQTSFGMAPSGVTSSASAARFDAPGWSVTVEVAANGSVAQLSFADDSRFCVVFGPAPLAPSQAQQGSCPV